MRSRARDRVWFFVLCKRDDIGSTRSRRTQPASFLQKRPVVALDLRP